MESVSSDPISDQKQPEEQTPEQLQIQQEEESRTVEISNPRTRIRGVLRQGVRFPPLEYVAFLGIRYALPPVGELRFQPPKELPQTPADQPTELFLAYVASHACVQPSKNGIMGSEDCLYLNVFTPRKPKDIPELLPVLVDIHGGGFTMGENDSVDPENLMRENLVVVTINYRLGIFGFLNMRTEDCLGNAGLKDQVMALKWVRNNIEAFGGDSKNVTICGHSAGGTCVNLHMLSPLSKGLFHKAIVMAGGIYCPWGYGGRAKHVKQLFKNAVFRPKESRQVTVEILKKENASYLMEFGKDIMTAYSLKLHPMILTSIFKPSVEYVEDGAFLPDTVEKLMEVATPVPTLAGITKQEGYMFFAAHSEYIINCMKGEKKFEDLVKEVLQQNLSWKDPTAVDRHFAFFKNTYFPEEWMFEEKGDDENKPMTEEEKQWKEDEKERKEEERKHRLATLCTDIMFRRFYDNFKIGNLLDEGGPSFYVYEFDYFAGHQLIVHDEHERVIKHRAAEHADDYFYLLHPYHVDNMLGRLSDREYVRARMKTDRVRKNISSLWSSFCRTGEPKTSVTCDATVTWEPHTEQDPHYLRFSEGISLMNGRLNGGRWPPLNAICELEPTIPSLPVSPQTPKRKCTELQQSQPELASTSTQAPDTECEVSQLSRPKPDQSTSQTPVSPHTPKRKCTELQQSQPVLASSSTQAPGTECEVSQLSRPKSDQSTSQTSTEEVKCESKKFRPTSSE